MIPASNYLNAVKQQIQREGVEITYTEYSEGFYDPETSSVTGSPREGDSISLNFNTDSYNVSPYYQHPSVFQQTHILKAFPAVCTFSEQQNPNLIGVASKAFLVTSTDLPSKPKPNDEILQGTDKYTVKMVKEHWGGGVLCMYRLLCVEG